MKEFEEATRRACEELARLDPAILAGRTGAVYSYPDRCLTLNYMGEDARISFPGGEVILNDEPAARVKRLIILHYLVTTRGDEPVREWVAYRDLPGARYHESAFRAEVELPLAQALELKAERIRTWVEEKGLERGDHGEISFIWEVLPRVPLLFVLNPADEEFPAEARVFYDATAPSFLPTEDLEVLAELAAHRLIEEA
jgi:hypothetical protein